MQNAQAFFAPAKLNLFLHITGQREDGYHLLQTVFQLLNYGDTVYLKPNSEGVVTRSNNIPGVPEQEDLVVKAAQLLKKITCTKLGVDIGLEKRIPMGGGLGGGSSDAATVLLGLNHLWNLKLSRGELAEIGLKLGADVPFFIFGRNAWAEGIGEKLEAISLPERYFLVLTPKVHVSTKEIFSSKELTRDTNPTTIAAFSKGGNGKLFHNDMQQLVSTLYPEVGICLNYLNHFGDAMMTGSGASVFVEFETKKLAELVQKKLSNSPKELSDFEFSSFVAHGLLQHPLYNLA